MGYLKQKSIGSSNSADSLFEIERTFKTDAMNKTRTCAIDADICQCSMK